MTSDMRSAGHASVSTTLRQDTPSIANRDTASNWPILVTTILVLNVMIFLAESFSGGSTNTLNLTRFGAQHGPSIEAGEYWRFITAAFLHIGFWHLFFNSLCLWFLGRLLEQLIGAVHLAFVYLVAGIAGSLTSFFAHELISPRTLSAGASGGIFGIAGAMFVAGLRYKDEIPDNLASAFGVGALPFIFFNVYYGIVSHGIDNYAHLGGVLAGVIAGSLVRPHVDRPRERKLAVIGFTVVVLACFGLQYRAARESQKRLQTAEALYDGGQLAAAQQTLAPLLKTSSENPHVLGLSGAILCRQGKIAEGGAQLRRAIRLAPQYAPPRRIMGDVFLMGRSFAAAEAEYRAAIRLDPSEPTSHMGLAEALLATNRREEAETEFREAIRLNPNLAQAHYGLAIAMALEEKREQAEAEYRAAVKLKPSYAPYRRGLAKLLLSLGKTDEGISEVQELLRADPNDAWAKSTLAATQR